MKLYYSPASPFARKVLVVAHETGLIGKIEIIATTAHPIDRNKTIIPENPLGQIPTLVADDGQALYDSRVICEYLDVMGGNKTFSPVGESRWRSLTQQAMGDGLMGAALLVRYEETTRPENLRSEAWRGGQLDKIATSLAAIDGQAREFGDRCDIGTITIGCALGYLDLRFPTIDWRKAHPQIATWFAKFNERPSMQATAPRA